MLIQMFCLTKYTDKVIIIIPAVNMVINLFLLIKAPLYNELSLSEFCIGSGLSVRAISCFTSQTISEQAFLLAF